MVSDDFLPNPGGIAAHVFELSRALGALGHQVDLIVGHDEMQRGELPPLGAGVRLLRQRAFAWNTLGYASTMVATAHAIRRARRQAHYDVCHWHSLIWETWGVAAGARGLPRVFTNHSSGYLRRARSKLRLRTQLHAILRVADRVIAPSPELLERSRDAGYPRERLHYIANGVDTSTFSPGPAERALAQRYGLSERDRVLIAPRRLEPKNGVDVLIRALPAIVRAVPQTKLLLVGDGSQRSHLSSLIGELGLSKQVVFCGSRQRQEMLAHLRLAELAVLPSRAEAVSLAG
ncbi:MAG TPA: glycosyltransferase family 4 protein, partial [Polyangiales bacterium]